MGLIRSRDLATLVGLLAGCSGGAGAPPDDGALPIAASARPTAVLLAVPRAGGRAVYHDAGTLAPIPGLAGPNMPPLDAVWGVNPATGALVGSTPQGLGVAIDLESGRVTEFARDVALGLLGPSGTAYAVTSRGRVATLRRRERKEWSSPFQSPVRELFGGRDGRLLAVTRDGGSNLVLLGPDGPPAVRPLPPGDVAATRIGDLVAVAADSGIVLIDATGARPVRFVPVDGRPVAVAFSPSGHRVYFTLRRTGVGVIDRFAQREVDGLPAPEGAAGLRVDPMGRWLLARPAASDSFWVIDVAARRFVGSVRGDWGPMLPAVTPDGVLLAPAGGDLVAHDPGTLHELAREALGDVFWVPTRYLPRRLPTVALTQPQTAPRADSLEGHLFVQVASSQNPAWAADLANSLVRDARLPARVLDPVEPSEGYRVVIGPYRTRDEASAVGTKLGRPFWIFTRERSEPNP